MIQRLFRKKEMDDTALKERVMDLLRRNRTMTLACGDDDGIWSAPVFYANDGYSLIWVSNPNSRHSKAFEANGKAAVSIYKSDTEWQKIQGLQISGHVEKAASEAETKQLLSVYTRKFPFTGAFFSQKGLLPEPIKTKVKEKVRDVTFYRLIPDSIRLVDNTIRFGFKFEFTPDSE